MSLEGALIGLAAALQTISGLRVYKYIPDSIYELPCALLRPQVIIYNDTMGSGMRHSVRITLLLQRVDEQSAQDTLMDYIAPTGTKSVKSAVELDPTLGGYCDSVRVQRAENYGSPVDGYIGVDFAVEVID